MIAGGTYIKSAMMKPANAVKVSLNQFLEIRNVSLEYVTKKGSVRALDRVDLGFDAGSFVCIIGPSGCGKTTLMQMLGGFIRPSTGEVSVGGECVTGPAPDRGVVFQQPALFPWMTVYKNAEFGPMVRHISADERRKKVEHYLRMVGLWEFRNNHTYELSGGMQQRLAITRVLANEPRLLLMDEPFGALDALTREKMQQEIHAIWRRTGMTVVFITHSVEEAVYLGTHVVVLSPRPGRVLQVFKVGFSTQTNADDIRLIKASSDFVATREKVLGLIWDGNVVDPGDPAEL